MDPSSAATVLSYTTGRYDEMLSSNLVQATQKWRIARATDADPVGKYYIADYGVNSLCYLCGKSAENFLLFHLNMGVSPT